MAEKSNEEPSGVLPSASQGDLLDADTFITGINDSGRVRSRGRAPRRRGATEADISQSVGKVKELHGELSGVVSQLSEKVTGVLAKQESEFMGAYRAHMFNVQKELQQLRARVDEAELAMKKNDRIRELERARDWFRTEAQRLDEYVEEMKRKLQTLEDRLEVAEHDRDLYKTELKTSKKKNKVLLAELKLRMTTDDQPNVEGVTSFGATALERELLEQSAGSAGSFTPVHGGARGAQRASTAVTQYRPSRAGRGGGQGAGGKLLPPPHGARAVSAAPAATGFRGGAGKWGRSGVSREVGLGATSPREVPASENQRLREQLRQTRRQLDKTRRDAQALRAAQVSERGERNELEDLFLRCVEDARRDVERRRNRARAARSARSAAGTRGPAIRQSASRASLGGGQELSPPTAARKGEGRVRLQDFTPQDRRHVLARMLEDENVVAALYNALFPQQQAPGQASGGGPPGAAGSGRWSDRDESALSPVPSPLPAVHIPTHGGSRRGRPESAQPPSLSDSAAERGAALDPAVEAYLAAGAWGSEAAHAAAR